MTHLLVAAGVVEEGPLAAATSAARRCGSPPRPGCNAPAPPPAARHGIARHVLARAGPPRRLRLPGRLAAPPRTRTLSLSAPAAARAQTAAWSSDEIESTLQRLLRAKRPHPQSRPSLRRRRPSGNVFEASRHPK